MDDGGVVADAAVDAAETDGGERACEMLEARHFDACAVGGPPPGEPLPAPALTGDCIYDTSTGMLDCGGDSDTVGQVEIAQSGGPTIAVLLFEELTIPEGTTLRVSGDKPLVLASLTTVTIDGDIDARSYRNAGGVPQPGPGSDDQSHCSAPVAAGPSGGGGGGGFAGAGGDGGDGNAMDTGGGPGGAVSPPALIVAGCSGAPGADEGGNSASTPGAGGGALEIVAGTSITVTGSVLAGGMGAARTGTNDEIGGAGGGSGGYLGFDAPMVTFADGSIVAANGGGGAEGSDDQGNGAGEPGSDSLPSTMAAPGGDVNGAAGGAGGDGSDVAALSGGLGTESQQGGGGGGGAAGFILVSGDTNAVLGAVISPPVTPMP